MDIYGNVNALSGIDRIYSNRYEMEKNCGTDGVFMNRCVQIKYDSFTPLIRNKTYRLGRLVNDKVYYNNDLLKDQITMISKSTGSISLPIYYYQCDSNGDANLFYVETTEYDEERNSSIDKVIYNDSYDLTTWKKVFEDGQLKYIKVE